MKWSQILFSLVIAGSSCANAQQATDAQSAAMSAMEQKIRDLEDRVVLLEGQLRQLKAQGPVAPVPGAPPTAVAPATPPGTAPQPQVSSAQGAAGSAVPQTETVRLGGAGAAAAKALNPDISVIGDFISGLGHNPVNPTPTFQMHESEVGLQAIVDPYARADFFISFGEEGVNLEEGFITFTALPKNFVAKVGKMRAAFGKVNTLHNHVLPWVDRPLVSQNLVGGEDGINDAGLSLSRILPAPEGFFVEATAQIYRGDSYAVFQANRRSEFSYLGHLRIYRDLTDSTN